MSKKLLLIALLAMPLQAKDGESPGCGESDLYGLLDFWLGEWDVYVRDEFVGRNTIERTLAGCAVLEHWTSAEGGRGLSLFFVDGEATWKQVWVTDYAMLPGGVKEKTHQPLTRTDQVRFQGRIYREGGQSYLDRTTLTDLGDGRVRQVIEVSQDEGEKWRVVFDAEYRRKGSAEETGTEQ